MKLNIHDAILIALFAVTIAGCKKDCPPSPVTPKINEYRMYIEIIDNPPYKNVYAIFAMGRDGFPQGYDSIPGAWTGQDYMGAINQPVYVERNIFYSDFDSVPAYLWIGTSQGNPDNNFRVEVFRNDTSVFKEVGYVFDSYLQIN